MYLDSFLKYLEFEKRYSRHTIGAYQNDLEQFKEFTESQHDLSDLAFVNYSILRSWIVYLSDQGLEARSINRKLASLRSFFRFLVLRGIIKDNPTIKARSLKTPKKLPEFIKQEELIKLLDYFPVDSYSNLRDLLIIELLYGTGMRLSELLNLKHTDVDLREGTLKVLGKRNKERIIPINQQLVSLIENYLERKDLEFESPTEFLIVTDKGLKAYPVFVQRIVSKYLSTTGSEKSSPHVLRHSYATHLLNEGADLNAVKELLGHANLAATQVYTHNSIEKLKKVFNQAHPKA